MNVPEQWRDYPCEDYFASSLAIEGFWDEAAQLWLIEPMMHLEEDDGAEFLQVGRPGVDDIGFGYREGRPGFWAFHRLCEPRFQYLASSITEFLNAWLANRLEL